MARDRQLAVEAATQSLGDLTERELVIAGVVAYWAEGTKRKPWNPQDRVVFTNSDVDMIRLFLRFLELSEVTPDRLRLRLSIHESASRSTSRRTWTLRPASGPRL
jgi:hypothetical protein